MPSLTLRPSLRITPRNYAFSLIELLTVLAIVAILSAGTIPAVNGIRGGQGLTKSAYDVAGLLEQARSLAMSKNTYVYVGIAEASENTSSVQLSPDGGQVIVSVMASKSGVRPMNMASSELNPICRLLKFDNLKLDTFGNIGNMASRQTGSDVVSLADSASNGFASFTYSSGGSSIAFDKVIEFDPKGVARFSKKDNIDTWIEVPLKPAHGAANDVAALQVDGVTGAVRVYRP